MTQLGEWSVEFYIDARGRAPAREFIRGLRAKDTAVCLRYLDLLEEYALACVSPTQPTYAARYGS